MSREGALAITLALGVVLLGALVWAWQRRSRRDAALIAPVGDLPAGTATRAVFPVLYVATTRHGEPLERLAIKGLGYRSRADVTVTDAGIALDLTGQPRVFVPVALVVDVSQSTVAIDRVVERDGLVRLSWHVDDHTVVDSYLRPQDSSARALADAVAGILRPTTTGTDA